MSLRISVSGDLYGFEAADADALIRQFSGGVVKITDRMTGPDSGVSRSITAEIREHLKDALATGEPFEPSDEERAVMIMAVDIWARNARSSFPESAKRLQLALRHSS